MPVAHRISFIEFEDVFRPAILQYLTMFLAEKLRVSMNQSESASDDLSPIGTDTNDTSTRPETWRDKMIRDYLSHTFPNDIHDRLTGEEEKHLFEQAIIILRLLSMKGKHLKYTGGVYAEAIDLEFIDKARRSGRQIKTTPESLNHCFVCHGTNIRPSAR